MAFTLPNVKTITVSWYPGGSQPGPGQYGSLALSLIIQGPENPNMQLQASNQYYLPEETPALTYLEAYQKAYQYLYDTLNLSPDQADQYEQWNQRIVDEVNSEWESAGLSAPDLNANDWSPSASFFTTYANKVGEGAGQFTLNLGFTGEVEGSSGF